MTEYVYALHDFAPEHDDEIAFKAGERIEVVEKDEQYGDGWWQGRNLAGKVGLFPQGYTSASTPSSDVRNSAASSNQTSLQPLTEEHESPENTGSGIPPPSDGAVMAATLTDVQEAIEQLGVGGDHDASRSFSFASTHGGDGDGDGETDKETETEDEGDGGEWHKDARKALAERAKKENARKEREEAMENSPRRMSAAPPIPVELSDESDAEDEEEELRTEHDLHPHHRKYSSSEDTTQHKLPDDMPPPETLQPAISLVNGPVIPPPSPPPSQNVAVVAAPALTQPKPHEPPTTTTPRVSQEQEQKTDVRPTFSHPATSPASTGLAASVPLPKTPSPANGTALLPKSQDQIIQAQAQTPAFVHVPVVAPPPAPPPAPVSVSASMSASTPLTSPAESVRDSLKQGHPYEWGVDQVVAWLRSKNIDEQTCSKFIEHEITGDVLLDLDVALLKELDISAFGKRMRIANAILELRRPASFSSEQHAQYALNGFASPGVGTGALSAESSPRPVDMGVSTFSHRQEMSSSTSADASLAGAGATVQRTIPAQLTLTSPSDSALQPKAPRAQEELIPEEGGEENVQYARAVQSESEGPFAAVQRRFRGRSTESGSSKDKDSGSKDSPLSSPMPDESGGTKHHMRGKRSLDGSSKSASDRLSFFSSTLGKGRKPPPRYSIYESDSSPQQSPGITDRSTRGISRLYFGQGKKNGRPTTPVRNEKHIEIEQKENDKGKDKMTYADSSPRDPALLRKRATPAAADKPRGVTPAPMTKGTLNPNQSVLEQIGRPDHAGWLRKKGERYNTWKLRYMVLKGPHLYYLRSNNRTETKIKGYIKVQGYKVVADSNANPGKYGFRIVHDVEPAHYFSSEDQIVVREWMKSLMKATIDRDFSKPVVSSCNIPTIPLTVAQAMNPTPRPPSPGARAATQRALRRENPNQLSSRDARVLMGLPSPFENGAISPTVLSPKPQREGMGTYFTHQGNEYDMLPPPRPSRGSREPGASQGTIERDPNVEAELIFWANSILPLRYHIRDITTDLTSGLILLRLAENIEGKSSEPPVPDSMFAGEGNLEGMFKLFDFLVNHDVKMGSVSINDVKYGRPDKITQLLKSLKQWHEKRKTSGRGPGTWLPEPTSLGNMWLGHA